MVHFDNEASRKLGGHKDCCDNCKNRFGVLVLVSVKLYVVFLRLKQNLDEDLETTTRNYGKEAKLLLDLIMVH